MCFKSKFKYCNPSPPLLQTKMQKCYHPFFTTEHAHYLPALPFLQSEFGWEFTANSASLTPYCECLEVGQVLAAHYFPGGRHSVTQDSPATPSFLESLAGWWPPLRRARTDVAPSRAHQPQPGLTGGVTQVQPGVPPARWDRERAGRTWVKPHRSFPHKSRTGHPMCFLWEGKMLLAWGLGFLAVD